MSSFDNQIALRSQEFGLRARSVAAQEQSVNQQAMRDMAGVVMGGLQAGGEMAIRVQDANMRNRLNAQELQQNDYKFYVMQQMDQLRFAQLQYEMGNIDKLFKEAQYREQHGDKASDQTRARRDQILKELGPMFTTDPGGDVAPREFKDEAERKKWVDAAEFGTYGAAGRETRYAADSARQVMRALEAKYSDKHFGFQMDKLQANKEDWQRYLAAQRALDRFLGTFGAGAQGNAAGGYGGAPTAAPTTATTTPAAAAAPQPVEGAPGDWLAQFPESTLQMAGIAYQEAETALGEDWGMLPKIARDRISVGMGRGVESLLTKEDAQNLDPQMAARIVVRQFQEGGMEGAFMLALGGYDESQIRAWLASQGRSDEAIEAIMRRLNDMAKTAGKQ